MKTRENEERTLDAARWIVHECWASAVHFGETFTVPAR